MTNGSASSAAVQQTDENIDKILNNIKDVITNNSAEPNSQVLELTEKVEVPRAANSDAAGDDILNKIDSTAAVASAIAPLKKETRGLVDDKAALESTRALKDLMKITEKSPSDSLGFRSGTTLEEIVMELIKPELSAWLNKNLPNIVTQVVQKEIKKLIPKDE